MYFPALQFIHLGQVLLFSTMLYLPSWQSVHFRSLLTEGSICTNFPAEQLLHCMQERRFLSFENDPGPHGLHCLFEVLVPLETMYVPVVQ
jgi:hypothetical protein